MLQKIIQDGSIIIQSKVLARSENIYCVDRYDQQAMPVPRWI